MELTAEQCECRDSIVENIFKFVNAKDDVSFNISSAGRNRGMDVKIHIYDDYALITSKQFRDLGKYCKRRNWDRDTTRLLDGGKDIYITGYVAV